MFQILLDNREKDLHYQLTLLIQTVSLYKDIQIECKPLPIGDIILQQKLSIEEESKTNDVIIFERKTVKDLQSSIYDGRYKEQSYRLDGLNHPNHNIMYLIEGEIKSSNQLFNRLKQNKNLKIDENLIYSSLFSLNYYKGFSVIRTFSLVETANFICHCCYNLNQEKNKNRNPFYTISIENDNESEEEQEQENKNTNYVDVIKKIKKENITQENIKEIMLCQIPGISPTSAKAIFQHYDSLSSLLESVKLDPKCLVNITFQTKEGKTRKINKKTGEIIQKYLC
jgi:ERCC4-type nuclease